MKKRKIAITDNGMLYISRKNNYHYMQKGWINNIEQKP